jgi:hypothetical protein
MASPKDGTGHLLYPGPGRDTAERGMGGWQTATSMTWSSASAGAWKAHEWR